MNLSDANKKKKLRRAMPYKGHRVPLNGTLAMFREPTLRMELAFISSNLFAR